MQQPRRAKSPSWPRLSLVLAAVIAVSALIIFAILRGGADPQAGPPSSSPIAATTPLAAAPASATPPSPSAAPDPGLGECTDVTEGFVPQRFTFETLGADEPVIALNLDDNGNIAAPPPDQPRMASWWSGGPKPGADKGMAVMSIHTYNPSLPPALGNEMYDGGVSQFEPGDLIKLHGADGQVQCYEYTHDLKLWVDEYDPDSDVMVDYEGDPRLVIIICWDYESETKDWASRILFYANPVNPNQT